MAEQVKDAPAPARAAGKFVVMHDGVSVPGGHVVKNQVVAGADLGDADRVKAIAKLGAVRAFGHADTAMDEDEQGRVFLESKPAAGVTVEQLDAQIEALQTQRAALVASEKAAKK